MGLTPKRAEPTLQTIYGHLTEAPGRLTPTGPGRIKAPPTGCSPSLIREASNPEDLEAAGVCFSAIEAAACASSPCSTGRGESGNDAPFNVGTCEPSFDWTRVDSKPLISSNSTVVTNTSVSTCGFGTRSRDNSPLKVPPLAIVQTVENANSSDYEHFGVGSIVQEDMEKRLPSKSSPPSESVSHSTVFNEKLLERKDSRQGRSLQRWLVHSPTEELVRQAAGCIPITRDGRIILVSASRKAEWILPKGGWDSDETRSECAARETYEEAGVLGSLGSCLEPIDYETRKSKKRKSPDGEKDRSHTPHTLPKRKKTDVELSVECIHSSDLASTTEADQAIPLSSDRDSCKYIRLFLYPLYVTDVKQEWPENGRLRKLVNIDDAIAIMDREDRPYFRAGLLQLKARGLNIMKQPLN